MLDCVRLGNTQQRIVFKLNKGVVIEAKWAVKLNN